MCVKPALSPDQRADVEAMDYFRAVLKGNELSARALAVTSDIIDQNPSFYTAWHYRRLCLRALGSDLRQELAFVDTTLAENQKNYQIWYRAASLCAGFACSLGAQAPPPLHR